jgi:diaminopimelate decarboxylase
LYCEDVRVADIAQEFSTPLYIYSLKTLVRHFRVTDEAFGQIPHIICYAAKANPDLALLRVAALCGLGCDVVSEGELRLALKARIKRNRIVFSGAGKTDDEIELAIRSNILLIGAESIQELERINEMGRRLKRVVPVSIRVNPDIDPGTHPYIATGLRRTKFGVDEKTARDGYRICQKARWLDPLGISMHIGSQIESVRPYVDASQKIVRLFKYLWKQNIHLRYIDVGGGWAAYFKKHDRAPHPDDYVSAFKDLFAKLPVTVIAEPGRSLVGNAGILVMRVIGVKQTSARSFCIVDAGMNDFIRPALYGARHRIEPARITRGRRVKYDVVGPVCENADFLGKSILLPKIDKGDFLSLLTAGAYGSTMSSNYNGRRRAAEVAVAGKRVILIRRRETFEDLTSGQDMSGIDEKLIRRLH